MTSSGSHADIVPISLPTPFRIGPVNAFLVRGDALTLVDTGPGTDDAYDALQSALREHGESIADLEVILITHGHVDHVGLLARLVDESGAKTFGHRSAELQPENRETVEERSRAFILETLRSFGAPPELLDVTASARDSFRKMTSHVCLDYPLEDGNTALGYTVHHVPGHSASDTLFVDANRRLAFTGDHILKRVSPTPMIRQAPDGRRAKSLLEYQRSLVHTRSLPLEVVYPGHGDPFTDHVAVIDKWLDRIATRTKKVLTSLENWPVTPYELCCRLFPEVQPGAAYMAIAQTIGHLDVLEDQGCVTCEPRNGLLYYRVA